MKANLSTIGLISVAILTLCSCAPGVQLIDVEKRVAPRYNVELSGKSIAIFSALDGSCDSTVVSDLSKGIASSLEKRLSREEGSVFVYNFKTDSQSLNDPELIKDLSVKSNSDLVFVLSEVKISNAKVYLNKVPGAEYNTTYVQLPFSLKLDLFDGITAENLADINQRDTLLWEILSRNQLKETVLNYKIKESFLGAITDIVESVSQNFFEKWDRDARSLYFLFGSRWQEAIIAASEFNWSKASEIWLEATSSENDKVAACAAYNLAVACEMQDKKALAVEWLKYSEKRYPLDQVESYKQLLTK
ncbi:hypothetical protein BRDCF_p1306 [Bacteroidales bacterium CF]|nr:hypothetical protein BRDCF_p1306 [Bacteroidales bacterium CF]NCB98125.1 hypothetical protein [Bacteroidia bacterium]